MSIVTESKWDEDIRAFIIADVDFLNEVPADHVFVQGEPYGAEASKQFVIIRGLTYSFETVISDEFLDQTINMSLMVANTDWNSRASVLKTRRIVLLIAKIFLANVTVSGGYKLIFNNADVVDTEIPDNTNYPNLVTLMTFSGLRELETAIVP